MFECLLTRPLFEEGAWGHTITLVCVLHTWSSDRLTENTSRLEEEREKPAELNAVRLPIPLPSELTQNYIRQTIDIYCRPSDTTVWMMLESRMNFKKGRLSKLQDSNI